MKKALLISMACSVLAVSNVSAAEFTADATMKAPNGVVQKGKVFIAKSGSRFDFNQGGQGFSQITNIDSGKIISLNHKTRTYFEYTAAPGTQISVHQRPSQPCKASAFLKCEKTGTEKFAGLDVEKWTIQPKGAPEAIKMLWEKSRKLAVHQELPGGAKIHSRFTGSKKYEGLDVEVWKTSYTSAGGEVKTGSMYFAPSIQGIVSEKSPNGMVKEMRNIKIGAPSPALFAVPEGYKKIMAPTPASTGSIAK